MLSSRYQLKMLSGTLYSVALVRTDVSDNISPPSSGLLWVIEFHNCLTVESLLFSLSIDGYYLWSKNTVFWDAFTSVSIIDASIIESILDTVVKAFWKTASFDHNPYAMFSDFEEHHESKAT
jgi:hypothetical protein